MENLKINEVINDTDSPEKEKGDGSFGVEIVKAQDSSGVVENLKQFESALLHDQPVRIEQVLNLEKSLDSMKVVVGGDEMTVGEMRQIPDLEKNVEIWEEIKAGDFSHYDDLTYLTSQIAHQLSGLEGTLHLSGLTSVSDIAAEHLSRHQGGLILRRLTTISDTTAEHLSHHQGTLYLTGLTSISDTAAKHLSQHHQGELSLYGLTVISDIAAEHLSRHQGDLSLNSLTSISDTVAKHLSQHQGTLFLLGLTTISDIAAEHLSHHQDYLSLLGAVRQKVDSFKKPKS